MAYTITIDEVTSVVDVTNSVQSIEIQEVVNNIVVESAVTEVTVSSPSYPITVEYNAVQLDGVAATIAVGTVTTGAAGSSATVTNSGTTAAAVFDFAIPRGATGATGTAATINAGTTTTGAAGTSASVTNSGTSSAAVFNFTVPQGIQGATGATGAQGTTGDKGDKGDTGNTGAQGATGAAATIAVGTVTTGAAGSSVAITNAGTSGAAVFNFAIPRGDTGATGSQGASLTIKGSKATTGDLPGSGAVGDAWIVVADGDLYVWNSTTSSWNNVGQIVGPQGDTGATGATGAAGAAASIQVGTVVTGAAGSTATITNSGTSSAATFNFSIPRGDTGTTGAGVAVGGTTGQILAKIDGTNYNTQWVTPTDTNTTYTQNASTTTGGANLNLVGSDSTTDAVKFASGTGITVSRTDADTISIASTVTDTNTTYAISAETNAAGADIRLTGSDASTDNVTIAAGTNITVTRTDANTVTIASSAGGGTVAETLRTGVYNADSVTLTKGMPVYVFGAQGQQISVKRAINGTDQTSAQTLGLVEADIAAGAEGYVVTFGEVTNINTSTYTEGAAFYLGSTAGTITFTKPYAPNHLVYLGFVEKANASSGRLFVKVQNGYELDELHNVNINHTVASANKDYLVYNSSNDLWENRQLDIVNDTTPQLGGNLDVNGYSIVSASSGNISIVPNGTGNIVLNTNTSTGGLVRVGDGTNAGVIVANGAVDLLLLADPAGASQASLQLEAATGDVRFGPGGSGSVRNTSIKTFFGDGAAATTLTSNGAYNLTINTNDGTNTGASITLTQGTNGGLSLTPAGSGGVTIGAGSNTGVSIVRRTQTTSTGTNVVAIQRNYTTDTLSTMDGHFAGLAFSQRDSTATQSFYTRIAGVYSTAGTHSFTFDRSTDNFTTPIRQMALSDGQLTLGATTGTTAQVITSYGTQDISLVTNQGTDSGLITITNGANGNISITPNGTGDVLLVADTIQVGDSNAAATITTNGTGNLTLSTNNGTNSGTIAIANGVNGNISITPNGTGIVVLDGLNWPITGGTANYVLTTNGSTQTSWSQLSLTAGVTGTLPIANGGTNATTARDAWDNLTTYTATNSATATLTNASNYIQHIYGGSGTTFTLPSTATMQFGEGFYFINDSGSTATINTHTSALVGTIPTGSALRVHVVNTGSNAATSWIVMREFQSTTGTGAVVLDTSSTISSPTISGATLSGTTTSTGAVILKDIRETVYTGGSTTGSIAPDSANGSIQAITLTGSITFNGFANSVSGESITLIITQPATGGPYTLTSSMKFAGASKTLSTAANAIDILTVSYIGTTYYASLAKGFA